MKKLLILLTSLVFTAGLAHAQIIQNGGGSGGGGGGAPSGPAGGDLGSTYPNPTVVSVAHVNTGVLPVANGGTQCSSPTVVASLPGSPVQGEICNVTDATTCTAGTTVTGGAATPCQVTWNGTSWLPAGGALSAASGGVTNVNATSPLTSTHGTTPTIAISLPLVGNAVTLSGDANGASNATQVTATHLTVALPATQGGTGSTSVPTAGQLPIGNNINTAYAPITVGGDGTLNSAGTLTVTKSNGVAFSALATQALPCTPAQGCTGNANLPTPGQLAIGNAGGTAYAPMSVSGDATLTSAGVLTVTGTSGTAFGPFATQTSPCTVAEGCTGGTTAATSGRVLIGNGTIFAPVAMSGDATIVSSGAITVTKTNGVAFATSATTDTTNATNISSGTLNNSRLPANISVTNLTASSLTPGNCLQASTAGLITDTGAACGSGGGGSGTVQTGLVGQVPVYNANGTTVSPEYPNAQNIMAAPFNAACDSTNGTNGTDDSVAFGKANGIGGAYYIPAGTQGTPRICKMQVFAPGPGSLGISGVVGNGTTATVTIDAQFFNLPVGKSVIIAGTSHFNGTFTVTTVPSTTTFTFSSATSATDTAGGTVSWVGVPQTWDGGNKTTTVIALQGQSGGAETSLDHACNGGSSNIATGAEFEVWNVLDVKFSNFTVRNYGTHTAGAGKACIVGIGTQPNNARQHFFDVDVDPNETASVNSPLSVWAGGGLDSLVWQGGSIGNFSPSNSNSQAIFITGSTNNIEIDNWNVFPNADTTPSGGSVHFGRLPMMQMSEPTGGASSMRFHQIRLTKGINGVEFDGANQATVDNVFSASDIAPGAQIPWWQPSLAVNRGDFLVSPSALFTGACVSGNIDVTSISINTSSMWVNEPIFMPCVTGGSGVGGHFTFITSIISSSEIHVNNAPSATGTANLTVPTPNMHVYEASVAGTTGATVPTFPLTGGGTVPDGGVTWMEYGEGAMIEDNATQPVTARDLAPFQSMIGIVGNGATTFGIDGVECSSHNVICVEEKNDLGGVIADADIESVTANQDIAGILIMGSSTIDTLIGYSHVTLGPARSQAIELDAGTNGFLLTDNQLSGLGISPLNWIPATAQSGSGDINPTISEVIGINSLPISGSPGANQLLTTNGSGTAWIYQTYFPDPGVSNGVLVDNSTATGVVGVTAGTTGQMLTANTGTTPTWGTAGTTGQILNGVTSAAPAWVTAGTTGQVFTGSTGAAPVWKAAGTTGQIFAGSTGAAPTWIAAGTTGQVLTGVSSATPAWGNNPILALTDAPMWMHSLSTSVGTEADPNVTSGTTQLQGFHYYANFTIGASGTVNISNTGTAGTDRPQGDLFVVSPGTCTIAGAVTGSASNGANNGGGSGGGGGFGGANGSAGQPSNWAGTALANGGTGGLTGSTGGTGNQPSANSQKWAAFVGPNVIIAGSQGGAGNAGGSGGGGGAGFVLVCQTINYTGTVTLNGANGGGSTTAAQGGGGGGGGGVFIEGAQVYTANTGTTTANGGNGGTCTGSCASPAGAGGAGGAGWTVAFTL